MNASSAFRRIVALLSGSDQKLYKEDLITIADAIFDEQALRHALRALVTRCDGAEGVQPDGSNMDTRNAHFVLGDFDEEEEE